MRKLTTIFAGLLIVVANTFSFNVIAADKQIKTEKQRFSYALGIQMGGNLKQQGITEIDADVMAQAIKDVISGTKPRVSKQDMQAALTAYQKKIREKRQAKSKVAATEGGEFRKANKKKKGVNELKSGIQYEVLTEGKGKKPKITDTVTVHYHGSLISGKVFDSSVKRGKPATFPLKGVIKGWQEVVPLMPMGSKWRIVIPPELAYGERGTGASIGPNETLIFEIELIAIK